MNEILTSLGRWDLDLHQVRAHMYGCSPYSWWINRIPLSNAINRNPALEPSVGAQAFVFGLTTSFGLIVHSFTQMPSMAS